MAFVSRVGNMLKQTIRNHVKLGLAASKPSVYQAIRCMSLMSSSKVFVGGFPYSTDEPSLRETFAQYGEVVEARIVTDRETGRSRGFGFVSYTSNDEASNAIQALDGKDFQGRMLRVNYAAEKSRTGFGSSSYGNSGSSYGNSGDYGSGGTSFTSIYGNSTGGGSGYSGSNYGNNAGIDGLGGSSSGSMSSFGGEDSGRYDGTTGRTFGNQGGRIGSEDFDQDVIEENNKVNNHEVHEIDYANTRG